MRLLIQRVKQASVKVEGKITGEIEHGLLVFVGFGQDDTSQLFKPATEKVLNLRIFNDDDGKMNRSVIDEGGGVLLVSQFTLYADVRKGRRPSYISALGPQEAESLYKEYCAFVRNYTDLKVESGLFGADMKVDLLNDGPVTIWLDSEEMSWKTS